VWSEATVVSAHARVRARARCQGNQQNRAMMLNSKVVDYINYILRAAEFKHCDTEKVPAPSYLLNC